MPSSPETLNFESYRLGISELASRDPDLAKVLSMWGHPPFWTHAPGFPGIVISILAQQVSLESAKAAFAKLERAIISVSPEQFLSLDDRTLKEVGFSHQKTLYVREIARAIIAGDLDLQTLKSMDNELAQRRLVELKGIGPWTANAYLLFSLCRADAWPAGDLALVKAIHELKGLASMPTPEEVNAIADHWIPWRGVAARMLWYHYLCSRGRISSA